VSTGCKYCSLFSAGEAINSAPPNPVARFERPLRVGEKRGERKEGRKGEKEGKRRKGGRDGMREKDRPQ